MASNVNSYASLTELKAILGVTSTTDDVIMRKILEGASRFIETNLNRHFYSTTATKYFDGAKTLWIPDLLSITTLKTDEDGDGTFENTLQAATEPVDYLLYGAGLEDSYNTYPKTRIELGEDSDYGSFANGIKRGVEIAGVWGYGDGTSATPYVTTAITGTIATTTGLTLTLSAEGTIEVGHTILCESEQMYVTAATSDGSKTATVERGVNGSTAATHSVATLYYYRYPRDIMQACIDLSVALYQNRSKQGLQTERIGDYSYTIAGTSLGKSMVESILGNIHSYKRMRF